MLSRECFLMLPVLSKIFNKNVWSNQKTGVVTFFPLYICSKVIFVQVFIMYCMDT